MQSFIRTSNFWLRLDVLIFDDHPRLSFMTYLFSFFFFFLISLFSKMMTSLGDGGEGYPKLLTKNDTGEGMLVKSDVTKPKKIL